MTEGALDETRPGIENVRGDTGEALAEGDAVETGGHTLGADLGGGVVMVRAL